jgi:hypothetical protein
MSQTVAVLLLALPVIPALPAIPALPTAMMMNSGENAHLLIDPFQTSNVIRVI